MPDRSAVDVFPLTGGKRRHSGPELARLAAKQHGVVSVRQLRDLGFTARQVEWLTEHGHLHRLYRGVYAVGHLKLTRDGRLAAALLAAGDGAFLSHRTAAALQRLRNLNLRRIDVTVAGAAVRPRQGIRIHRTSETPVRGEVTELNGLRVSTVPRLLVELAATETQDELGRLIDEAVRKRAFDHANLRTAIDRHDKRPGIGKLKAAYAAYVPRRRPQVRSRAGIRPAARRAPRDPGAAAQRLSRHLGARLLLARRTTSRSSSTAARTTWSSKISRATDARTPTCSRMASDRCASPTRASKSTRSGSLNDLKALLQLG